MGDEQERKLFVRGLNRNTSEEAMKHYFEEYGCVVDCNIMRDQEKRSRGFGFILYEDVEAIDKIMVAKKEGGQFVLDEHTIEVKRALPKTPRGATGLPRSDIINRKVFVGGLPSTVNEQDVRDYFETFGRINEIQLIKDRETGRPRGFAFLTFDEEDSADKCLQRRTHEICRKMCEVKRAQAKTKEERSNTNNMDRLKSEQGPLRQALPSEIPQNRSGVGLPPSEVNKLIQQAFAMGQGMVQQSSIHQPLATETPPSTSILLQALAGHQTVPQVQPPPPATQPQTNLSQLAQLIQSVQSGGLDASVLGSLLKNPQQVPMTSQVVPQVPVTSMEVYNSPPHTSYTSISPTQKSGKEDVANTRANRVYRPY